METIAGDIVVDAKNAENQIQNKVDESIKHKDETISTGNVQIVTENNNIVEEELLGSVTRDVTDGPTVRSSARVIHKMRMDSTSVPTEKKEPQSDTITVNLPKTPSQSKQPHVRVQWVNSEKSFFFDALNEYGRDFEHISRFINAKMKRKTPSDQDYKTKEHIRQIYYKFYLKASKYLCFSDDVKKVAQELYTLINYGEMKRKLQMTDKSLMKLRELVYKGVVTIRIKGKNIKVKTPSCRALRKLNQLECNTIEDIQLPQRIDVILRPVNMKSWGYVQTLAQNPRLMISSLPLQKRVASLFTTLQQKWQTSNGRLYEKYVTSHISRHEAKIGEEIVTQSHNDTAQLRQDEPVLLFIPPSDTVIHRPMVQLNEVLSSYNLCLNSYEERIGATNRGENLVSEKVAHIKDLLKHSSKRMRNDSASDKNSNSKIAKIDKNEKNVENEDKNTEKNGEIQKNPENVKNPENNKNTEDPKKLEDPGIPGISVIDHKSNDSNDLDVKKIDDENSPQIKKEDEDATSSPVQDEKPVIQVIPPPTTTTTTTHKSKKKDPPIFNKNLNKEQNFKPLIDEEELKKIRQGWTLATVGDLTVGDLYLMFGNDSRLVLEYECLPVEIKEEPKQDVKPVITNTIGNKLKSLLAIANLLEGSTNPYYGCERSTTDTDPIFKQPNGPRPTYDVYNRATRNLNFRNKSLWMQHRPRNQGIPNHFVSASANHKVRDLYETPPSVESPANKKQSDKDDEVTKILEDKIQNLSGSLNYSESSRSSMRSLLDCLSSNDLPKSASLGDVFLPSESSFSMRLHEETVKLSSDDIDNFSLSSFLCQLDKHAIDNDNDQGI